MVPYNLKASVKGFMINVNILQTRVFLTYALHMAYSAIDFGTSNAVIAADIGGGTSDFSLVRIGPQRMGKMDRKRDAFAHHGVHVAGTDIDRRVELAAILQEAGYRSLDTEGHEIPNGAYFELASWQLINSLYTPKRQAELRLMRHLYRNPVHHDRLMRVVKRRLGHALAASAEQAKIAIAAGG